MKHLTAYLRTAVAALTLVAGAAASRAQEAAPAGFDAEAIKAAAKAAMSSSSAVVAADSVAALPADSLTAEMLFIDAPTEVVPSIDPSTRLDMIDYFKSGMSRPSKNLFGGECRITAMTDSEITFTTSGSGERTIALLPKGKDRVVMVITTVKTPTPDSTVKFFTTDWQPRQGLFMVPLLDDWTLPDTPASKREDLENAVPFMLAGITYDPSSQTITLTNNLGSYLPEEVAPLNSALHSTLIYRWDGHRFKRVK